MIAANGKEYQPFPPVVRMKMAKSSSYAVLNLNHVISVRTGPMNDGSIVRMIDGSTIHIAKSVDDFWQAI